MKVRGLNFCLSHGIRVRFESLKSGFENHRRMVTGTLSTDGAGFSGKRAAMLSGCGRPVNEGSGKPGVRLGWRRHAKTRVPQICVLCMSALAKTRVPQICVLCMSALAKTGVPQICVLCMSATVRTGGPSSASASSAKVDPQNVIGSGSRRRHARSTCLRHPDDPYLATSRGRPSSPKKEILRFTGSPLVFNKMISVWYPPPSAI